MEQAECPQSKSRCISKPKNIESPKILFNLEKVDFKVEVDSSDDISPTFIFNSMIATSNVVLHFNNIQHLIMTTKRVCSLLCKVSILDHGNGHLYVIAQPVSFDY